MEKDSNLKSSAIPTVEYHGPEDVSQNTGVSSEEKDALEPEKFNFFKELAKTPRIADRIYNLLPQFLKSSSAIFKSPRERDVYLTSVISVLSGIFSKVKGTYHGKVVHPNLFCFIVAPAASGKSGLNFSRQVGAEIHATLLKASNEKIREYLKTKSRTNNGGDSKTEKAVNIEMKPKRRILFIPANSSSASVISHLEESNETGIIVETEADTMTNSFKQDWGGYSDLLRKAFHHEPISYSRKRENEFIELNRPKISVALTGTPSQIRGLIKSASDGLFSRFMFYSYSVKQEWSDVSPNNLSNLDEQFSTFGNDIKKIFDIIEVSDFEFSLKNEQWQQLNKFFQRQLKQTDKLTGGDAPSTVKRLGLITYRLAMVFTILRSFEAEIPGDQLVCSDQDFEAAILLSKVYFEHALFMYTFLCEPVEGSISSSIPLTKFINKLETGRGYKRKDLISLGKALGYPERTVDSYLKKLCNLELLSKSNYGEYTKK